MRIQYFYVQDYQVLHKLTLPIEEYEQPLASIQTSYKLDLIVGVNGTGKSTLLRLLAELFQRLLRDEIVPFRFKIEYLIQENTERPIWVLINNMLDETNAEDEIKSIDNKGHFSIKVVDSKKSIIFDDRRDAIDWNYLPLNIIALTSGNENNWELGRKSLSDSVPERPNKKSPRFQKHLLKQYQQEQPVTATSKREMKGETATEEEKKSDRFLLLRRAQFPLIVLCGLLTDRQKKRAVLTDALAELKIKSLNGFSLKLSYKEEQIRDNVRGNDDFTMIQNLIKASSYTIKQGEQYLVVFQLQKHAKNQVENILQIMGDGLALFKQLDRFLQLEGDTPPILQEVNLFFSRDAENAPLHLLDWLSDGEISFLARFCLFSLLRGNEALVLLDEPEVHFNDYWKRQLVAKIDQTLEGEYCHILMTTHSSITLSDVYNSNIWVLKRNGAHTDYAAPPSLRTLGTDPSDIIVHIFGAETATGAHSAVQIQKEIDRILGRHNTDSNEAKRRNLERLMEYVGPGPLRFLIRRLIFSLKEEDQSKRIDFT